MGWYRGQYVIGRRSLAQMMAEHKKDYHFRVRNKVTTAYKSIGLMSD